MAIAAKVKVVGKRDAETEKVVIVPQLRKMNPQKRKEILQKQFARGAALYEHAPDTVVLDVDDTFYRRVSLVRWATSQTGDNRMPRLRIEQAKVLEVRLGH